MPLGDQFDAPDVCEALFTLPGLFLEPLRTGAFRGQVDDALRAMLTKAPDDWLTRAAEDL